MIKYILHGGYVKIKNENNKKYFKETMKSNKKKLIVLLVYLARKEEKWKELEKIDKKNLSNAKSKGQSIKFVVASKETEKLRRQIETADILFIRGGRDAPLFRAFRKIKNLKLLLQGKTVSGTSAGAYLLSKYCYNMDYNHIDKGLGLLPIKTYCHYKPSRKPKLEMLKKYKEKLKTIVLADTEFVVLKR